MAQKAIVAGRTIFFNVKLIFSSPQWRTWLGLLSLQRDMLLPLTCSGYRGLAPWFTWMRKKKETRHQSGFITLNRFLNPETGIDLLRRYDFQLKKSYKPKLVSLLILRLNQKLTWPRADLNFNWSAEREIQRKGGDAGKSQEFWGVGDAARLSFTVSDNEVVRPVKVN